MFTSTHVQPRRMAEAPETSSSETSSSGPRRAMPGAAAVLRRRMTAGVGALAVAAVVGASVVASASASGKQSLSADMAPAAQVKASTSTPTPRHAEQSPDAGSRVSREISRSQVRAPQRGILTPDTVQGRITGTPTPRATPSATRTSRPSSATSSSTRPSATATEQTQTSTSVNLGVDTSGLSANTVKVMKVVKAKFPQVTFSTGGDQDHATGHAVDLMTSSSSTGDAIAEYVRANHASLGVHYIIWSQKIWNVQRDSEGWRAMEDRGSATANHYDHVHVSVF